MVARSNFSDILTECSPQIGTRVPNVLEKKKKHTGVRIRLSPSQWATKFIKIKGGDTGTVLSMDFSERPYLQRPYDTGHKKILLLSSRQSEKSTTLGNKLLTHSAMRPMYTSLFVTPSAMQTKVFSNSRLADIIDISPLIKGLVNKSCTMNILEKEFSNRSKIYLRYAFLSADRTRGLSVNGIYVDEIQDMLWDLMPVIEETSSHHKDRLFVYSGTPKTFDNTIENYWAKHSTQSEWVIPCDRHYPYHWNILDVQNLGKTGPICEKCGGPLNPEHEKAQWAEMNIGRGGMRPDFEGYRICRLMVPWYWKPDPSKENPHSQWETILRDRERYPIAQFMNEVMARSYDSGQKPLSRAELVRACDPAYDMSEDHLHRLLESHQLYGGIDWGTGESGSYTLLTIGGYTRPDSGFQIVFSRRYEGPMTDPEAQLKDIIRMIVTFRLQKVVCDYGMGLYQNKKLISIFGPARIHLFQYVSKAPRKILYKPQLQRYLVTRTSVMADVINAIKAGKIRFPAWEKYEVPYANDMLALRAEYSNTQRMTVYNKPRGIPDDSFHAAVYCLCASMFDIRRPDIMDNIRELYDGIDGDAAAAEYEQSMMSETTYAISNDYGIPPEGM